MHDPNTLAHTVCLPIPRRKWKARKGSKPGLQRRRRTNEENFGEPIYPWWRPAGWMFVFRGWEWGLYVLADIWHVDPETDGSDDSCDWFNHKAPRSPELQALADAVWHGESLFGNPPHFRDDGTSEEYERWHRVERAAKVLLRQPSRTRFWHIHPRWHFWHWRIRVPFIQHLKRSLFSRCEVCGGRFKWGYSPISRIWSSAGPLWFRSQEGIRHHGCDR